ncbi:hypothetical protein ACUXV3_05450 [Roseobacteraceae bacterium NS-SX3]
MPALVLIVEIGAVILLTALLARSRARHENKNRRGCEPGRGDQIIDNTYYSGGPGGGHGGITLVTRDPHAYTKAMCPRK